MAAFNPSTDLPALKTEIETDPVSQGYGGTANFNELARLINSDSVTGATKTTQDFSGEDLLEACLVDAAEYGVVITADVTKNFMQYVFGYRTESVDPRFKDELLAIFNNVDAPNIRAAIIAAATGPKSRAEELWEDGDVITAKYIEDALEL